MTYKYKCGNEIIRVWVWNDDFHKEVSVDDAKSKKSYNRTIREDKQGRFFTWNKNKIYLHDWVKSSMKEFNDKVDKNEWVISDDLCQAIMSDGVENVRFIVPLNTTCGCGFLLNGDEYKDTLCKVVEGFNREVKTNYKLTFVPVEPNENVASRDDIYTDDLIGLIKKGYIKIVV